MSSVNQLATGGRGDSTRSDGSSVVSDTGTGIHSDCTHLAETRGRTISDNYGESLLLFYFTEEKERRMMPGYHFSPYKTKTKNPKKQKNSPGCNSGGDVRID